MYCIKTLGFLMVLVGYAMAVSLPISKLYRPPVKTVPEKIVPVPDLIDEFDDKPISVEKPVEVSSDPISVKPVYKTELPLQSGLVNEAAEEKSNLQNKNEKKDGGHLRIARALGFGPAVHVPARLDGSLSRRVDEIFGSPIRKEGKQDDDNDEDFYK